MSSIVKIAKIAPSASIVYQFLVFFCCWHMSYLGCLVHKEKRKDTVPKTRFEPNVKF